MTSANQSFLRASNIYLFLALVLFAGSVIYGIMQFNVLNLSETAIASNKQRTEEIAQAVKKTQEEFQTLANEQFKKRANFLKKINSILPADENYTELAKQFDNYFSDSDKPGNPIFQSNLNFGKGAPVKGTVGVSVLPFTTNLEGSRSNLFKFLEFVRDSGSLENGVRLLEIKSIDLSFPEEGEQANNPKQEIKFNVSMNAYYQTSK